MNVLRRILFTYVLNNSTLIIQPKNYKYKFPIITNILMMIKTSVLEKKRINFSIIWVGHCLLFEVGIIFPDFVRIL